MLAVVEDDQQPAVTDEPDHRVDRRPARLVRQTQCAAHRDGHQVLVGDRREVDVPNVVAEIALRPESPSESCPNLLRP